jgi:hypothetical protein
VRNSEEELVSLEVVDRLLSVTSDESKEKNDR